MEIIPIQDVFFSILSNTKNDSDAEYLSEHPEELEWQLEPIRNIIIAHIEACKKEIAEDYLYYLDGDEGSEYLNTEKFFKEVYPLNLIK